MASPGTSADDIEERLRDLARTIAPGIRVSLESSAAEHGLYTLRLGACFRSSVSFPESELSNPEIVDERFRNAVDRLLAHARRELLFDAAPEYRQLSRLHEIATERTVQLSAIIERARKAPPVETFEGGLRQDSVYTILDSVKTERTVTNETS